jgi:hypothetical protein
MIIATKNAGASAAANTDAPSELKEVRPEQLIAAGFLPPSTIALRFADGLEASLNIELLGMPVERIDWPTLMASPEGEKVIVNGIKGDPVPIDAATIRYLVDAKFAAQMDADLKRLQFTDEELENLSLDQRPAGLVLDRPEDLIRESWK